MTTVVQKYGGSSLATVEQIRSIADRIASTYRAGRSVVVVVSARGDTTDELLDLAAQAGAAPPAREVDQLLATGECTSAALLAIAIRDRGVPAASLTGGQAGVLAGGPHRTGLVESVRTDRIRRLLSCGTVAVVAGFQGVNGHGDVVTLGRGGSDTSAVAIAVALGVGACHIYTDVAGVFSADPRRVPQARVLPGVAAPVMAEMAFAGAGVLHPRCVRLADLHGVDIHVGDSSTGAVGTVVDGGSWPEGIETRGSLAGVVDDLDVAHLTVGLGPAPRHLLADVLGLLADNAATADLLAYGATAGAEPQIGFTLCGGDLAGVYGPLTELVARSRGRLATDTRAGKVSVVGTGLLSRPDVTAEVLATLGRAGIGTRWLSTSQQRTSVVVDRDEAPRAVGLLHQRFRLDRPGPVDLDTVDRGGAPCR